MKEVLIIFLITVPLLLVFILYSYIKLYSNLKKTIKHHNDEEEIQIIAKLLEDIYNKLPIIDNDKNNSNFFHEVQNK